MVNYGQALFLALRFFTIMVRGTLKARKAVDSKLPAREVEICARLREARLVRGYSQSDFAADLKIKRERLASYEAARAPLRFPLGLKVCRAFNISPVWLATGAGLYFPTFGCYYGVEQKLDFSDTDLFSYIFDTQLKRIALEHLEQLDKTDGGHLKEYAKDAGAMRYFLEMHLNYIFSRVPKSHWQQLAQRIGDSIVGEVLKLESQGIAKPLG